MGEIREEVQGGAAHHYDDLAQAFIEKGVSSYVGFDNNVGLDYAEEATINLIYNLSIQHMTIRHAVDKTMAQIGPGPLHDAYLKYYPAKSADKTLRQLTE